MAHGGAAISFCFWYWLFGIGHEMSHVMSALLCGHMPSFSFENLMNILLWRKVHIPMKSRPGELLVRHAGFAGSAAFMVVAYTQELSQVAQAAAAITVLEALLSDFMMIWPHPEEGWFFCGNFGLILLNEALAASSAVKDILEQMTEVTMVRGAQGGGVVTFAACPKHWLRSHDHGDRSDPSDQVVPDLMGLRARVVNQKRSTLSEVLRQKLDAAERWRRCAGRPLMHFGRIYAGHTRFATSSKATLDGVHPHQWSRPQRLNMYVGWSEGSLCSKTLSKNFEIFVTHNGDFDFFDVGGRSYELGSIQAWLERATWQQRPSDVDSAAIAGVMDLLRVQGSTELSARYGFLFGVTRPSLDYEMPPRAVFQRLGIMLDHLIQKEFSNERVRLATLEQQRGKIAGMFVEAIKSASILCLKDAEIESMAETAIDGFFQNDLLQSTRLFMTNARGSFGLSIVSSVDAHRQMIIASFGQSMSVAFYPESQLVLYASEQAAVKAAIGITKQFPEHRCNGGISGKAFIPEFCQSTMTSSRVSPVSNFNSPAKLHTVVCPQRCREELQQTLDLEANRLENSVVNGGPAIRIDLDDLGGEICLLDWGSGLPSSSSKTCQFTPQPMMKNLMTMTSIRETRFFPSRLIPLEDNPLVFPLPPNLPDPVGRDIKEIPQALKQIQIDWRMAAGPNRASAWSFGRAICARLREQAGNIAPDAVDLLITGCEVSLWLGEQMAADLALCFKRLVVKAVSSNKLLGLSLKFPMAQTGHTLCDDAWDLRDAVVLIISHSGATFSPLALSKLLPGVTREIFAVTSEWDTQIGKQLRDLGQREGHGKHLSHIFTTNISMRPAEPCSISVAATHQLLTEILMYVAFRILVVENLGPTAGAVITKADLAELERLNRGNIQDLQELVGHELSTEQELRRRGREWAQHVLETPRAWILSALYIVITVTLGVAPIHALLIYASTRFFKTVYEEVHYMARMVDAAVYLFLPQIMILCVRLLQRRPLLHRMTSRTIVVGDVPWVVQCVENFASKLFACSYSATAVTVFSANPADHLVHRMTHRIVRGTLLACGRPDGRLVGLTSAEQSVCLAVNQASSIQSLGETCESLTIGHNPYKLPLTAHHVCLKTSRPQYLCEYLLASNREKEKASQSVSSVSALMGSFANLAAEAEDLWTKISKHQEQEMRCQRYRELDAVVMQLETDDNGLIAFSEFERGFNMTKQKELPRRELQDLFKRFVAHGALALTRADCRTIYALDPVSLMSFARANASNASSSGELRMDAFNIPESVENTFGMDLLKHSASPAESFKLTDTQRLSMLLYEGRIASLQRAVAFFVLFHEMGKTVCDFWPSVSFGILRYRMDRTQSIMRIASTASPVSGADVREKILELETTKQLARFKALMAPVICDFRNRTRNRF